MKKFLVLYRMDLAAMHKMMESMSKEDQAKSMGEWTTWMQANAAQFTDPGAPVGKNMQVTGAGVSQVSNDLAGYSVVQADSVEAATAFVATGPHMKMPGATCDVMELMPMM